jgi:hypothetical protein
VKKRLPPARPSPTGFNQPRGILELDRFNSESLARWGTLSRGLNELQDVLYFGLEPERRRLRSELVRALASQPPLRIELTNWARISTALEGFDYHPHDSTSPDTGPQRRKRCSVM